MDPRELYRLVDGFPRFPLFTAPTPIQRLPNFSSELKVELYLKRDDLTGLAAGGNKTRKLEYLIGQAVEEGADTVLTAGWYHSNHALQTAAAAGRAGLGAILVLKGKPHYRGSLFLDRVLGADIRLYEAPSSSALLPRMTEIAEALEKEGKKPYIVPVGGSNPTGALGYVRGAAEIAAQAVGQGLGFDYLVCPTSSGGTQAGIMAGVRACLPATKVLAIGAGDDREELLGEVHEILRGLSGILQLPAWDRQTLEAATVTDYDFGPYGRLIPQITELIRSLAGQEGIFLDPVYTGKAFSGLVEMIRSRAIPRGSRILFLHTGGLSSLFQYEEEIIAHLDALA